MACSPDSEVFNMQSGTVSVFFFSGVPGVLLKNLRIGLPGLPTKIADWTPGTPDQISNRTPGTPGQNSSHL